MHIFYRYVTAHVKTEHAHFSTCSWVMYLVKIIDPIVFSAVERDESIRLFMIG